MVAHDSVIANLNAEQTRELAQPIANPSLSVAVITPLVWVGTAEKRSSNTASDAVVSPDTIFIDDIAAGKGWHGTLRVQVDAASEALVFVMTQVDKIPWPVDLSSILGKTSRSDGLR
jgi:hypothetical protein